MINDLTYQSKNVAHVYINVKECKSHISVYIFIYRIETGRKILVNTCLVLSSNRSTSMGSSYGKIIPFRNDLLK